MLELIELGVCAGGFFTVGFFEVSGTSFCALNVDMGDGDFGEVWVIKADGNGHIGDEEDFAEVGLCVSGVYPVDEALEAFGGAAGAGAARGGFGWRGHFEGVLSEAGDAE